jgi:hypothetical protein
VTGLTDEQRYWESIGRSNHQPGPPTMALLTGVEHGKACRRTSFTKDVQGRYLCNNVETKQKAR